VTYAQARDLTYGSQELRPPRTRRRPAPAAAAGATASAASPEVPGHEAPGASGTARLEDFASGPGISGDDPGDLPEGDVADALSEMAFKTGTESVKAARDFTTQTLREWQLDALIEDAVIVASELVTNAIRHGMALAGPEDPPGVELAWQRFSSRVTCVVTDGSSRPPVLSAADMSAESGRGLQVVHAIAAAWGWMMIGAREKAVWATLVLPPGSLLPRAFVPGRSCPGLGGPGSDSAVPTLSLQPPF
jgi:anti-sigma regulatory factor (Ser/Thr protein kinase)